MLFVCFFKQKTAYEVRISDWSSDVCSSDLERLLDYRELLQDLPNAEEPLYLRYPAVWEHSISATYDLDLGGTEIRLKGGVNNLFNRISPFAPDGDVITGRRANFNGNYDVRGRRFYLGVEARF